jgi:DMSO/TMAO reductase YedYZ molybdopterin-dependent catalytic subunit
MHISCGNVHNAEWKGGQLNRVLQSVGILPSARFVNFYAYDGYRGSIDIMDTFHSQTIPARRQRLGMV